MKKVLIVEDEKTISDIIKINLLKEGYEIVTAYDGREALEIFEKTDPDLILLDVMLPYVDGFQVCRKVRDKSSVPIIMLTAKEEEVDKVLGLELGADDYITKPFGMRELIARVKANIRRVEFDTVVEESNVDEKIIKSDNLIIDLARYEVRKNDEVIENPDRPLIKNLDQFPYPDRKSLPIEYIELSYRGDRHELALELYRNPAENMIRPVKNVISITT